MTRFGFLIFPDMLQLDFTGAYGVLAAGPEPEIYLIRKDPAPIRTRDNPVFTSAATFQPRRPLDVIVVPGCSGKAAVTGERMKTSGYVAAGMDDNE